MQSKFNYLILCLDYINKKQAVTIKQTTLAIEDELPNIGLNNSMDTIGKCFFNLEFYQFIKIKDLNLDNYELTEKGRKFIFAYSLIPNQDKALDYFLTLL